MSPIDRMGRSVIGNLTYTAKLFLMVYLSVRATLIDQAQGMRTIISVISAQIYFTGWQALPLISVLALASGGVVILQTSSNLTFGSCRIKACFALCAPACWAWPFARP